MSRFRRMRSLQKFASVHSSVHNHFNNQRNIERRAGFKSLRDAALREWRELLVVQHLLTRE
jgi:putative transposase